jgi:hypothetical protein
VERAATIMTVPRFGRIMPVHGAVLSLIGWRLSPRAPEVPTHERERLAEMRRGHAELVRTTDRDFGYDLSAWREFLLLNAAQFGYRHPYGFASVDRVARAAMADPVFHRLAAMATSEGEATGE